MNVLQGPVKIKIIVNNSHIIGEVLNEMKQPLRKWAKETLGASTFLFLHIGHWDKISLEGKF